MDTFVQNRRRFTVKAWFQLCKVRHILSVSGLIIIAAYFALRDNAAVMTAVSHGFVRPWQRIFRRLTAHVPFSVAECLIVIGVLGAIAYVIAFLVGLIRKPERIKRVYRFLLTCLTAFSLIYGGFCLLWGVYYYTSDFEAQSGIVAQPLSVEQLETVTRYFTDLVNEYGEQVARNEDGTFAEDMDAYFAHSPRLYLAVEREVPCLALQKSSFSPAL